MKRIVLFLSMLFMSWTSIAWSNCSDHSVKLQVLGSGGPELTDKRASTSYLVWVDHKAIALIDMGGGSSLNYETAGANFEDLDVVAFSHFHVDHSADFPALIKGSYFTDRKRPLPVFGPDGNNRMPSTKEFLQSMFGSKGSYRYLQDYLITVDSDQYSLIGHSVKLIPNHVQSFQINPNLILSAVQVHHGPLPALAWRVDSHDCSITFSGDMNNDFHTLEKLAVNTDILVAHNAIPENASGIARKLHMPPSEIGIIAKNAHVKKLVISHRMMRTLGNEKTTEQYIRKSYTGDLLFANDLDLISP